MEHEHDPVIGLDSLIKCRTCGKILPYMEEHITKVSSALRVRRILEEIAVAGKYRAAFFEKGFVVYSREKNGIREEVTGEKLAERQFRVYKRLISVSMD